jgi:hypothetical protein
MDYTGICKAQLKPDLPAMLFSHLINPLPKTRGKTTLRHMIKGDKAIEEAKFQLI